MSGIFINHDVGDIEVHTEVFYGPYIHLTQERDTVQIDPDEIDAIIQALTFAKAYIEESTIVLPDGSRKCIL